MRNRKYESMTLEEQEYARLKYLELKRAEWRKYYEKNKKNKIPDKPKQYKYLDIIDRCNDTSTLRTYKTFTDITQYELKIIANKIKQINQEKHKENLEKSYIQRDVEQQISYQKSKDKMIKDFLAKGGKIKVYDFGL